MIQPEPAVVLTIAGVDRVLADVDHLLREGDAPQYAEFIKGFVGGLNDLQGIDRIRPIGVLLFLDPLNPGGEPAPMIGLPLNGIEALQTTVAATGNELQATGDPRTYRLRLGTDELRLAVHGGYGFITKPGQAPPAVAADVALRHLEGVAAGPDLTLAFRPAGIPPASVQKLIDDLRRDAQRELAPKADESDEDYRLRADLQRGVFELLELVLTEGEELSADLTLEPQQPLALNVAFRTQPQGALGDWIETVLSQPRKLLTAPNLPVGLRFQSAIALTGPGREIARRFVSLSRRNILREFGPETPADLIEQFGRALDALDATAAAGRLESRIEFQPTSTGRFVLLAGVAVSQPEAIDGALRAALPLAVQAGDLKGASLDALRLRGLDFHEVRGLQLRERDRRLYGDDPALFVAAGRDAVWLALGGAEAPPLLAATLQPEETETPPDAAAHLTVRLQPWVELAAQSGGRREQIIADVARQTLDPDAAITAELRPAPDTLRLQARIDEDYIRWAARLAVLRARSHQAQ